MKRFDFFINVYALIPFRFNYPLSCNKIRKISLKKKKKKNRIYFVKNIE